MSIKDIKARTVAHITQEGGFMVRPGGIFRCGLQTLEELFAEEQLPVETGAIVQCKHCSEQMILAEDGVWEWLQPKDLPK